MSIELTIGMATYKDFDGVYFTLQALRLYQDLENTELLVIDNYGCSQTKEFVENWTNARYVLSSDLSGTASPRNMVFAEARGEAVLCCDCHVLFAPGAIARLKRFYRDHPDCGDLLQGPLLYDDGKVGATHFHPQWNAQMWGTWALDPRGENPEGEPFEIPMQGLGVFSCRRAAWPGFNSGFRGFGGEEGYIHEKFRQSGRRCLCLPWLRWMHRFVRPAGPPYHLTVEEKFRNYLIGHAELGLDLGPVIAHFLNEIPLENVVAVTESVFGGGDGSDVVEDARTDGGAGTVDGIVAPVPAEPRNPFDLFEAIYCINLDGAIDRWRSVSARFERAGIAGRVRRFPAISTPSNPHIGCALSHRAIIQEARRQNLKNVLVFEDDVILTVDATSQLTAAVRELDRRDWHLLYLGGCRWDKLPIVEGCMHLEHAGTVTCTHAIAYREPVYRRILDDVPADVPSMEEWLKTHRAIDQYYAFSVRDKKFLLSPVIATQQAILPREDGSIKLRIPA